MDDDLDTPCHTGGNDVEFLRQEVQELDSAVLLLSLAAPILVTIVAALLLRLSRKTAALLREAVGASAAASSHAQGVMTVEIKGAEGMPDMRVSMLEDATSAAAVSVPTDTPAKVSRVVRLTCAPHQAGRRYGLPPDLQWEVDDDGKEAGDALTRDQLEDLRRQAAFLEWQKDRNLSSEDVQAVQHRLHVFHELRRIDPQSFRRLTDPVAVYESVTPPWYLLVLDYVACLLLCLLPACAYFPGPSKVPSLILLVTGLPFWAWGQSRSPLKRKHQLWYEEVQWGHVAPPWKVTLAWLTELLYVICSCGLGALVSLVMRCGLPCHQSFGERLMGVRLIAERVSLS